MEEALRRISLGWVFRWTGFKFQLRATLKVIELLLTGEQEDDLSYYPMAYGLSPV